MTRSFLAFAIGLAFACSAAAGDVAFVKKPTAGKAGDRQVVSFSISAASDVEVAVVNDRGEVVRHLAAGMTSNDPKITPPSPLKPGLAQELAWDGTDDLGKPLPPGAQATFRVRLGMQARLGKVLFAEPSLGWSPRSARVGPDGLLYVLSEHLQTKSTFLLQAYTRDGKYVKTIMPYPANLPADRLKGLPRVKLGEDRWLPLIGMAAFRDLYPESTGLRPQSMPITSKGWILLVNPSRTHNSNTVLNQHVMIVDTDGGTPTDSYIGPLTGGEKRAAGLCWLALSPDEKWIYTSGQQKVSGYGEDLRTPVQHVVYRVGWDDKDVARPFVGEMYKSGNDQAHFNQPRGMDTDAAGRLYVCDYGNNRVAIFDADGKWAGKIDIDSPDQVAVDRKTGAVYVLTYKIPEGVDPLNPAAVPWYPVNNQRYNTASVKVVQKITKFARLDSPAGPSVDIARTYAVMTLDTSDKQPTLWLARAFTEIPGVKRGVEKVVDLGDKLADPVEVIKPRTLPDVYRVAASPVNDDVFVHSYSLSLVARLDGLTGETKVLPIKAHDLAVTPTGQLLLYSLTDYFKALARLDQFDRDGKPVNFAGQASHTIKDIPGSHWGHHATGPKGLSVSPRGLPVIIGRRDKQAGVWTVNFDGTLSEAGVVHNTQVADGSPVVDAAGNIYVASGARPPDQLIPPELAALGELTKSYSGFYGSVIKFGPEGGQFYTQQKDQPWPPADADKMTRLATARAEVYVRGATWVRPGFTVAPTGPFCACYTSRFCVDGFGRVFIPDVGQFSVFVVDGANNQLVRFGDYGNEDSAGPDSMIKTPAIPLAWPYAVSVGKSGVYVSDLINRRIVRVDMTYAAEAACQAQ